MIKINNILSGGLMSRSRKRDVRISGFAMRLITLLLLCTTMGASSAWADRIEPTVVSVVTSANENVRTTWCYLHFVNSNGGYVYCEADGNNLSFSASKRNNNDNLWTLIGTKESFVLRNRNGLYAKWDGGKYVGTADASTATPCTYTPNTNQNNTTYWNLHRLAASAIRNWNPQSGQIKEWDGDAEGGNRMEFAVVTEEDWNGIINPTYHVIQYSPAPTASGWSVGTHWYRIKNDRSTNILAACDGYMDGNGYLKTRGSGEVAENSDQWCFVQDANGKLTIYNKAAGTNKVLGSMTNKGSNDVRTKLYGKNEEVDNISKLYSVGANGSGYYVLIDGLANGYWDDNQSSHYLATWQDSQAPTSQGGRFIVSEVMPEGYKLLINGDDNYTVTYDNQEYHNGDILPMSIDDLNLNNLTDFSINCSDKFVYGPVINKGLQTITYTVKDMVTSVSDFTTGFYQLQLFDDNNQKVNNVNNRINGLAGNINTKSNAIYVMPYKDVPTGGDQNLAKYSGVPTYANEASTFFYIEKNDNNLQLQSVNGHYAVNDNGKEKPVATRAASAVTSGYAFPDGHLQLTGWVIQGTWNNNGCNGIEGPRMAYSGGTNYEKYNAAKVDMNQYSIYKVAIENATNASDIVNDPNVVIVGGSAADGNNRGLSKVYRNGYLFFDRGYVPTAADFNLNGTTYNTNFRITIGEEVNGITPITFSEIPTAVPFRVIITGDKKDDEVITYHNNHRFKTAQTSMLVDDAPTSVGDGESFQFRLGITAADLRDCDFSSSAASRTNGTSFVYGPIIDWENHTITCEIREAITALPETGWYQLKWDVSTDNNVAVDNRYTNAREDNFTNPVRDNNRFYLTMPKEGNPGTNEYTNYNVHPTAETAPLTFVKLVRSGNNLMMMTIDGRYLNQDGTPSTSGSGYANPVSYVANGELDFRHWFPFPSYSYMVGKASDTHNYFYTTPAKFDHSNLEFYEVYIHYEGVENQLIDGRSITYNGTATNYSLPTVYSGGYLVFPSGTNITRSEFTINNTADDDIKNVTIDRTNHRINIELKLPKILHRQSYLFDKLNDVSTEQLPGQGFIKKGEGMVNHPFKSGLQIQYTSNYTITQYVKQYDGTTPRNGKQLYMPTIDGNNCEVTAYQRWYDYKNEVLPDARVFNSLSQRNNAGIYKNGIVIGSNNNRGDILKNATAYLPSDMDEYWLAVDQSRYNDGRNESNGDLTEPSITMRVIYHLIDAKVMANALTACTVTSGKWQEEHTISYPNKKLWNGDNGTKSGVDYVGLNHEFSNYWCFDGSGTGDANLEQMVSGKLVVELDPTSTAQLQNVKILANGDGGINNVQSFARNRFIGFQYPLVNGKYEVPVNSVAYINVYMQNAAGTKFQLARINLTFIGSAEPLLITEVYGQNSNGEFKNDRSMEAMTEMYGSPVSELTFDHAQHIRFECPTAQGNNPKYKDEAYAFPLDFKQSSYGYHGAPWASRGEYIFRNGGSGIGGKTFYPVDSYKNVIDNGGSLAKQDNKYFLYVDASEQPGQVMSIPIPESLCSGSRMFCYGWFNSATQISQESVGIVLNIVGKVNANDETGEIIYSFNPGLLSTKAFDSNNHLVENVFGAAPWRQVGFSFLINSENAGKYAAYELQVMNNCYSTNGGDFTLDNFYIFTNPPKGNVDFTTPLCSDKVRHAKIHADYDMLKNISGVNDDQSNNDPNLYVTCCFLEASVFDNYVKDGLKISEIFEIDSKGNHTLKDEYGNTDEKLAKSEALINEAFGAALVGTRNTSDGNPKDHGFHVYKISPNYEEIDEYAYNDSKTDMVYREEGSDGVRRIIFKEDVIRGEMEKLSDGRYPHMRPSTEYYLVFSPIKANQNMINQKNTATKVFNIHGSCSFFGKFKTKDPMHVILDNADIEADLPIKAVCHGETTAFQFNLPTMKVNKPIVDEAYCISDESLNGKVVPESQGLNHYKYEASFDGNEIISGVIKNLPYDWWMGGKYDETHSYRGTIEDYLAATHPTRTYSGPKDIAHKQDGALVKIAQAMEDFRFYYPDFGKDKWDADGNSTLTEADWNALEVKDYNQETGYGLLQSEINTIKDFVNAGIIVLHRNTYDMPLTYEEAEELQAKELSDMMEKEMNDQILELALKLNTDPAVAALLPLKALEGTVLDKLSLAGKKRLTFEEFASFTREQLVEIAGNLQTHKAKLTELTSEQINAMPEGDLRRVVESALRELPDDEMLGFAKDYFPNIGHEKRAYLVVRALNILSRETVAKLPEADQQNTTKVRAKLREQMISIFSEQDERVLRKMWADTSAKLTEEERAALLKDELHPETPKNPATMNADDLAVLIEDALAKLTDDVINDLRGDRYVHFTLVPIMPSQKNFVDEPYIFCPDPRSVKLRITSHEPVMLDGFADMTYPSTMTNVPVRIGLPQIRETKASTSKVLRIPVRGLKKAAKDGEKAVKLAEETGYETYLFLTETDDPQYQQTAAAGMAIAKNDEGIYKRMVGKVQKMVATYPTAENQTPDNYLEVYFEDDMQFREGYTYRVGINFMEMKEVEIEGVKVDKPTISCYGTMLFDMKIVPEYQKWTASVNTDWTNDGNWARASRAELNAGKTASGSKIDATATALDDATSYIDNFGDGNVNGTANSFVPMYFTNVLFDKNDTDTKPASVLYDGLTVQSHTADQKNFLVGLKGTATANIIYDMEVAPADGKGTWPVSEGNYECTLFGTYVANGITFKPGSQLINAQHLTYNKAWVEYELTTNRWYTLASPLQNTFAGEWYAPTAGGRQSTPHFYGIEYKPDLNHRFKPAIYQRSWDSEGNNPVYLKTGGTQEAYIKADWSYVYNDVTKEYSNGGFSVNVTDDFMENKPADGKALIRMPKADTKYTYYDINNQTGAKPDDELNVNNNRYHLWSDKLKDAESFTQTITNVTSDNNFFLVGNPFMANMDMDAFFAANNEKIESKFWIMTANGQEVSVKTETGWVSTSNQVTTLGKSAPLQGFFVKGKSDSNTLEVTYNAAMQATPSATATLKAKGAKASSIEMLTIKATRDDISSTAVIALCNTADKKFVNAEDAETFIDSNIADQPTIYTVASGQAMTVNTVPAIDMIPLGIVGEADGAVAVTFSGMSGLCLYDSKDNSYTDINEGTEVTMEAKTAGRYFITSSSSTTGIDGLSIEKAERKGIYTLGGQYVGEDIKSLAPGLYIVNGVKMRVK